MIGKCNYWFKRILTLICYICAKDLSCIRNLIYFSNICINIRWIAELLCVMSNCGYHFLSEGYIRQYFLRTFFLDVPPLKLLFWNLERDCHLKATILVRMNYECFMCGELLLFHSNHFESSLYVNKSVTEKLVFLNPQLISRSNTPRVRTLLMSICQKK